MQKLTSEWQYTFIGKHYQKCVGYLLSGLQKCPCNVTDRGMQFIFKVWAYNLFESFTSASSFFLSTSPVCHGTPKLKYDMKKM